jgi:DnaK suppressor protein
MESAQLKRLRARLERERGELLAAGDHEIPPVRSDEIGKLDDDEAPLTEMNQSIASSRNRERSERLRQIAEALQRMSENPDEFGLCEDCEEPIPQRRLELMPWARLCIDCQSRRERDDRVPGSRRNLTDYR